jgi:hypothetical protein
VLLYKHSNCTGEHIQMFNVLEVSFGRISLALGVYNHNPYIFPCVFMHQFDVMILPLNRDTMQLYYSFTPW